MNCNGKSLTTLLKLEKSTFFENWQYHFCGDEVRVVKSSYNLIYLTKSIQVFKRMWQVISKLSEIDILKKCQKPCLGKINNVTTNVSLVN